MDYSAAKFWFDVVQTVLIAVIGLQNWFGKRHAATEADIKALKNDIDSKLNAQAERLTRVEQDLEHVPGKEDFFRVHERLDRVCADLAELTGEFHAGNSLLKTIHQYLMNGNAK
jgi:hypothetical protein